MKPLQLSPLYKRFSKEAQKGSSVLYSFLSEKIAEDEEILELAAAANKDQPNPNLLLGSVHYLLLQGNNHPLRKYFPSLTLHPLRKEEAFLEFRDFCRLNASEIRKLLKSKLVQTNEVGRCSYLYPCFSYVHEQFNKPLALIEIGTSAGLQLLWDHYRYCYDGIITSGTPNASVTIEAEIKSGTFPVLPVLPPPVSHRFGIDLHVNDLKNEEDLAWLKALIWPEHHERREQFLKAAQIVQQNQLQLIEGNGVDLLPEIIEQIPDDSIVCVFHTHVANQIVNEVKYQLEETLKQIGQSRNIVHLYNNMWDEKLHLDMIINGETKELVIGETDGHGRWFTWEFLRK
ncbi:DUF2332 domain-containing protein [Halobacillus massiliensis]|uniref:DUF2332 domain-containing protein n=1 Tax=Halobacillus massiliensis TaxID=1926286 RepID=UPI0009E5BC1D|nr:DUF2332 domain-containing protein [Halobacillus massiliensis]